MFLARHRVQHCHRPAARRLPGQLERARDSGHGRLVVEGRRIVGQVPLGRAADATGVEDARETRRVVGIDLSEGEEARPLEEEGSLLVEECLVVGEVDDGGVDLDLAEIGIDRGIEREIAAHTDPNIGPACGEIVAAVAERVSEAGVGVLATTGDVRRGFEVSLRRQPGESGETAEPAHTGVLILGNVGENILLSAALDIADELHTPRVVPTIEPEL